MVRITEDLLRKRAEHNNCEIFSLEEISLHQQEIERIEVLDKLCRDIKILYLQSNLIPKIENVGRLKKLEYLNLALNNVTRVENLEGCESLQKLDLTVNFIGELTSIESLRANCHFRELYLTGNPCTEFEGYREYVIATLDQLQWLDGKEVDRSERILAKQEYETIRKKIINQEQKHMHKREKEKQEAKKSRVKKEDTNKENQSVSFAGDVGSEKEEEEEEKRFWQEKTDYTPESRIELHQHIEEKRKRQEKKDNERFERNKPSKETRFFGDDGRVLNINQAKLDFRFDDDEDNQRFVLDLPCFKYLDTSLIDVDVQPLYVRVTIKSKVFQLALSEEVNPDSSSARRSQTTGHLVIEMPKVKQVVRPLKKSAALKSCVHHNEQNQKKGESSPSLNGESQTRKQHEHLEVEPNVQSEMDFSKIVKNSKKDFVKIMEQERADQKIEPNTEDFVDNEDVPPLV